MDKLKTANDFVCWCERTFSTLVELRKHQEMEIFCPVLWQRRGEREKLRWAQEKAAEAAQRKADLVAWEQEKARGPQ